MSCSRQSRFKLHTENIEKMLLYPVIFTMSVHFLQFSNAETKFSHNYEFPDTHISASISDNNELVYVRCDSVPVTHSSDGLPCFVGVKSNILRNSTKAIKECEITLKTEPLFVIMDNILLAYKFGDHKVLVVWAVTDSVNRKTIILKTTVVRMFGCYSYEKDIYEVNSEIFQRNFISNGKLLIDFMLFEQSYKVIPNPISNFNEMNSRDFYGEAIYEFDDYNIELSKSEDWPTMHEKNARNFAVSKNVYLTTHQNNGNIKAGLIFERSPQSYERIMLWESTCRKSEAQHKVSVANGLIGFTYLCGNSDFVCWQFDLKSEHRVQRQFTYPSRFQRAILSVYNLRNRGLLMAITNYENFTKYYLMKIDEKNQIKILQVQFHTLCDREYYSVSVKPIENHKQGKYCMVRLCQSKPHQGGRLKTAIRCYSSDEFSECLNCS